MTQIIIITDIITIITDIEAILQSALLWLTRRRGGDMNYI